MNKKLLGVLGVAALLLAGNFAWQETKTVDAEGTYDEVQALFEKYYNEGSYNKETVINLKENVQEELKTQFHASVNMLERTTYYADGALWMENEAGTFSYYGTDASGNMTSGRVANVGDTVESVAVKCTTMEEYYATLHDFSVGTHNSVHSNNVALDLTAGWEKEGTVYTSTSEGVLDAFRLFTAPLWVGKTETNENYIPFTKATVEESESGEQLIMKLYVSTTEYSAVEGEGKISDENGVFSQATISLPHTCEYSEFNKDATNHWYECECGDVDESTKEGHSYTITWDYNVKKSTCMCTHSTSEEKLVFNFWTNDWSNSDGANIYIYYWGDNKDAEWAKCTLVDDNGAFGDRYELTLDVKPSEYNKFIIVRGSAGNWESKWNQSGDLLYSDLLSTWKKDGNVTYYL